ncbi:MAG TPA: hypothetical protein DIT25_00675 [Candidatus Moranbacteria bacterium]|nr:hypothetical protein [Candidatus Moranbacteria bacterium]
MTIEKSLRFFFKGVEIDDRTEAYIRKRLAGIGKLLEKIKHVEVEISMDKKGKFRVEIMVETPYKLYRTEETSQSIEGSTDIAMDELMNQIKKDTEKVRDLRIRGKRSIKKKVVLDGNSRFRK